MNTPSSRLPYAALPVAAVALGLTATLPAAWATTPTPVQLETLLNAQQLPASLPAADPSRRTGVLADQPNPWGLQLCASSAVGLKINIPGPDRYMILDLQLKPLAKGQGNQMVQAFLYRYANPAAAGRAWGQLQQTIQRCSGTRRSGEGSISTLHHGLQPAPWVLNSERDHRPDVAVTLYTVFRQQGATLVVTNLVRISPLPITAAEQAGTQELAAGISSRLAALASP